MRMNGSRNYYTKIIFRNDFKILKEHMANIKFKNKTPHSSEYINKKTYNFFSMKAKMFSNLVLTVHRLLEKPLKYLYLKVSHIMVFLQNTDYIQNVHSHRSQR